MEIPLQNHRTKLSLGKLKFISWKFCTIKNSGGKIQKIVKVGGAWAMILFGLLVKLLC